MSDSLVLDTNVIKHYLENEETFFESCERIIVRVKDNLIKIALDHYGEIFEEYNKHITQNLNTVQGRILSRLVKSEFYRYSNDSIFKYVDSIDDDLIKNLDQLKFHPNDRIFVKIAPNTDLLIIVTTDGKSFLKPEYKKWIKENLEVDVMLPQEFISNK